MFFLFFYCQIIEVEKELGKKGKKTTLGSIQQAPELPTKTRTLHKNMENRNRDSPGGLQPQSVLFMLVGYSLSRKIISFLYSFQFLFNLNRDIGHTNCIFLLVSFLLTFKFF